MNVASLHKSSTAVLFALVLGLAVVVSAATDPGREQEMTPGAHNEILYTLSNNNEDGGNAVLAYLRQADGSLEPHPAGPFLTAGTGIDNDTNGKLGPNDNDTPLAVTGDKKRLFAVNGHTNTIAVFNIASDGSLTAVPGSPFPSMGIGPVSLAVSGDVLLVANRNEDPHQLDALRGGAKANYASFKIEADGSLTFLSKIEVEGGHKSTQVLVSGRDPGLVFGNDFQVDVDFDDEGPVSKLFGTEPAVRGQLHSFRLDHDGRLEQVSRIGLAETVDPAPEVPTVPLGIWDHPGRNLLYVGLVTRNQLGVYAYAEDGSLHFVNAVPNSGQDICWIKVNAEGTRLYAVNNLPREDARDSASTVTVFDISGERAEAPVEIGRVELPYPSGTFVNNRVAEQPNSTAFQFDIDSAERFLYVITQRIDQTDANPSNDGNILHTIAIDPSGALKVVASRHLKDDGVPPRARPQGVLLVDLVE